MSKMHFIYLLIVNLIILNSFEQCKLPLGLEFKKFHYLRNVFTKTQYLSDRDTNGFRLDVATRHYRFDLDAWLRTNQFNSCDQGVVNHTDVHVRFPEGRKFILNHDFNLAGLIEFLLMFSTTHKFRIYLANLDAIELDLGLNDFNSIILNSSNSNSSFHLHNSRLDFRLNGKPVHTCRQLAEANLSEPKSIFQIRPNHESVRIILLNTKYIRPLCPLLFRHSRIDKLDMTGIINTFYKRNLFSFTNDTFEENIMDSLIHMAYFWRCENIEVDRTLLNPLVFGKIKYLAFKNSVKRVDNDLFKSFGNLKYIDFEANYFRKLIRNQGIAWIRSINHEANVNVSDLEEYKKNTRRRTYVFLFFDWGFTVEDLMPDSDFCLWRDFPFSQMVEIDDDMRYGLAYQLSYLKPTCLYFWLFRYHNKYRNRSFKESENCDYDAFLSKCNKSEFHASFVWDMSDTRSASKGVQIILTVSSYFVFLFGLVTNSILIYLIWSKTTRDSFKSLKHYHYLAMISVCNIIVFVIEIFSWLSDCKETLQVFCPKTRRFIAIQFFKVIFKETLVIALRFMSNFCYIAFAFNRISLIGKDHSKLVKFIADVHTKKYILVTGLICIFLSVVKGFRYRVNYDHSELNYPILVEMDFKIDTDWTRDLYLVANFISDILNYVVFAVVNISIDAYMLVQLRKTLQEKLTRLRSNPEDDGAHKLTRNKIDKKRDVDVKEALNNAVRMVVVNSALNFFFKLPSVYIPLQNMIATFYYKSHAYENESKSNDDFNLNFDAYMRNMTEMDLITLTNDLSDWLFSILISIQFFVYLRYDKKLKEAFYTTFQQKSLKSDEFSLA